MDTLRIAIRSLWRSPGFTVAGVLVLAVGIAASTAVFSVLRGVVLRPLDLPHPESLLRLYERPAGTEARWSWSAPDYLDLANENGAFESVAALRADRQTLTGRGSPVQIRVARVTASFYSTLHVAPALGHAPGVDEDATHAGHTAVLTDDYWRREFNADPDVLGRTLTLDGRVYTIGGVMPRGFQFPLLREAQVLLPVAFEQIEMERRGRMPFNVVARLKPDLTLRNAQADLDVVGPRIAARIVEHNNWRHEAQPLLEDLVGPVKPALAALLGAVLLALLIACANVASLLLARGMARHRELAIRAALGGGRGALVRQMLTESLVLSALGGALSLVLAPWALGAVLSLAPRDLPRLHEIHLDGWVLAFAVVAAMVAGLLAGVLPALRMTRPDLMSALRDGTSGAAGRSRDRAALVVAETALAFVLAVGAGLMVRTLSGLLEVSPGLTAPERVLVADLDLPQARYPDARIWDFAQQLVQRLSALPGMAGTALMTSVPLDSRSREEHAFDLEGGDELPPGQAPRAEVVFATPGYLATLGVPLLAGRDIRWSDVMTSPHVLLVNEEFVRRYLPRGEPVGPHQADPGAQQPVGHRRRLRRHAHQGARRGAAAHGAGAAAAVGAAATARGRARCGGRPAAVAGAAAHGSARARWGSRRLAATSPCERGGRLAGRPALPDDAARSVCAGGVGAGRSGHVWRDGPLGGRAHARDRYPDGVGRRRVLLVRMVVGGGLRLALLGVALGVAGALAVTRVLSSLVYGVSTADPPTMAATAALLLGAAALASWVPAMRAARVDPAVSLRAE
jgi:predicted permease